MGYYMIFYKPAHQNPICVLDWFVLLSVFHQHDNAHNLRTVLLIWFLTQMGSPDLYLEANFLPLQTLMRYQYYQLLDPELQKEAIIWTKERACHWVYLDKLTSKELFYLKKDYNNQRNTNICHLIMKHLIVSSWRLHHIPRLHGTDHFLWIESQKLHSSKNIFV